MKNKQAEQWAKDNPEKIKEHQKKFYEKHKEKKCLERRNNSLKSKYGIDLNDYNAMLLEQNYACKICGSKEAETQNPNRRFAVDHCHTTGKVRGLLCIKCNTGLGMFNDNAQLLVAAHAYLMENT